MLVAIVLLPHLQFLIFGQLLAGSFSRPGHGRRKRRVVVMACVAHLGAAIGICSQECSCFLRTGVESKARAITVVYGIRRARSGFFFVHARSCCQDAEVRVGGRVEGRAYERERKGKEKKIRGQLDNIKGNRESSHIKPSYLTRGKRHEREQSDNEKAQYGLRWAGKLRVRV